MSAEKTELLLARSLFRADKWDPARDQAAPFEWDGLRLVYIAKSKRLLRLLESDGVKLQLPESV